ncbi:CPBP family intramembrane metalloprotease [bacterium]|nr:CPBP family intramembrane metalloprotease [bacterium]
MGSNSSSSLRSILLYLAAIFIGGSLIAPQLHHLVQVLQGPLPFLADIADDPFRRYVTRCWMITAIVLLRWFLRSSGIGSCPQAGISGKEYLKRELLQGLLIGFISLAAIAFIAWAVGARTWNFDHEPSRYLKHFINATLAAVIVGFIEELVFRGALFGSLKRGTSLITAILISSAVYAIVHFFERADVDEVHWYSGLILIPKMLRGFGNLEQIIPGFFNLTIAGSILAIAFQKTGRLWLSIGIHAGWIFWLKSYGFFTLPVEGSSEWLWGTRKLIDGWLALGILSLGLWSFGRYYLPDQIKEIDEGENPTLEKTETAD